MSSYVFKFLLTALLGFSMSSPAWAIQVGDSLRYKKTELVGRVVEIQKTKVGEYWIVQLEGTPLPVVAPPFYFNPTTVQPIPEAAHSSKNLGAIQAKLASFFHFQQNKPLGNEVLIPFKEYLVPVLLEAEQDGVHLRVIGKQGTTPTRCLDLALTEDTSAASLRTVTTQGDHLEAVKCPLRTQKTGTYILELVDALATALRFSKVTVSDFSKIGCEHSKQKAQLARLKTFQEGQGWYEKYGYLPHHYEEYKKAIHGYRNHSVQRLSDELKEWMTKDRQALEKHAAHATINHSHYNDELDPAKYFASFHRKSQQLRDSIKKFQAQSKSDHIADFMSWLWAENCRDYILLVDQFLMRSISGAFFSFSFWDPIESHLTKDFSKH